MGQERVVVLSGRLKDRHFAVERELTIGRNPQNTIVLEEQLVSRKHAALAVREEGAVLRDLGSGNGTFVNGQRIVEHVLAHGDEFSVGSIQMRYEKAAADLTSGKRADVEVRFEDAPRARVLARSMHAESASNPFPSLFQPSSNTPGGGYNQFQAIQDKLLAVYTANQIISQETELGPLFDRVMDQIFHLVPANNAIILLRDAKTGAFAPVSRRTAEAEEAIVVSTTIVNQVLESGHAVLVDDAADDSRFQGAESILEARIASAMCVPLISKDERLGAIYVDTRGTPYAFSASDLDLIVALAGPSAIAIKNAQYVKQLEAEFETTLRLLANAIEMRDHYTVGHTWRVTLLSMEIAKELGWNDQKLRELEIGGVLHDVGKIALSDSVLNKPGKLSEEEYAQMQNHPERGAALMRDCEKLNDFIPYCLYHHERYDGRGYPYGLKGEDIPIEGRVVAVADAFDAMTSNRPYRPARDPQLAVDELKENVGKQFDPACVAAFVRAYEAGRINNILQAYHAGDTESFPCPFCSTYVRAPEGTATGGVFKCVVCRRNLKLQVEDGAYQGLLLTESDMQPEGNKPDSKLEKLRQAVVSQVSKALK